jgi:hypothetical protein
LNDLMTLIHPTPRKPNEVREAIIDLSKTWAERDVFRDQRQPPDDTRVGQVAEGLLRLQEYQLVFQLIQWSTANDADDDDDYTLYERIGRGGVQITPRQLAVSKLMLALGRDGNNAVASFQHSEQLRHLLDTEEVIHALARVAFAVTGPDIASEQETEESKNSRDLLDLTPQRLNAMRKDTPRWDKFIRKLGDYCQGVGGQQPSQLQHAFEQLYASVRYAETNPNGFSFVQLAQPEKTGEGIAPITLHPLLFWYLVYADGRPADQQQRDDMLRWLLFANGLVSQPKHPKLNRDVFQLMVHSRRIDFAEIKNLVFNDPTLQTDLGFIWQLPLVENGDVLQRQHEWPEIPGPEAVTSRTARRLILQNWAYPGISWFVLLWNQREVMETLYRDMDYPPALFSKGRPFDADHIVARSRFLHIELQDAECRHAIEAMLANHPDFHVTMQMQQDISRENEIKFKDIILSAECFRKNFSNSIANYRYWPKRLNRSDQSRSVDEKMNVARIKNNIVDDPLQRFFSAMDNDVLWRWSAIPKEDECLWTQLPPSPWDQKHIDEFILATLKREYVLYTNAYRFLENK